MITIKREISVNEPVNSDFVYNLSILSLLEYLKKN